MSETGRVDGSARVRAGIRTEARAGTETGAGEGGLNVVLSIGYTGTGSG